MTEVGQTTNTNETPIPGLMIWQLPVEGDHLVWLKENWNRAKTPATGAQNFNPVRNNVRYSALPGAVHGLHVEHGDVLMSIATGRAFGAWVDLRSGPTFGAVFTAEIDATHAVYVPRGVGIATQTLAPGTVYLYLATDGSSLGVDCLAVNLADHALGIEWPFTIEHARYSPKDDTHPPLSAVSPVAPRRTLVLGADGQLGQALRRIYAEDVHVEFVDIGEIDLTNDELQSARRWPDYDTIINAAAYTGVDAAETAEGRVAAWAVNVTAVTELVRIAINNDITMVHISSDYVFDGMTSRPYREDDAIAPLGVYGQTKAAGDQIVSTTPRHYILRTSWLIGEGRNFVRTMLSLAAGRSNPTVVDDQFGRLTFTSDLARAIRHLTERRAPPGTYNMTCSGSVNSWADIARSVFTLAGQDPNRIRGVSAREYSLKHTTLLAPRPANSVLDLTKIENTGFLTVDAHDALASYVRSCI